MKYGSLIFTFIICLTTYGQSKKEQISILNREVSLLYDKISKLEVLEKQHFDSLQILNKKYDDDTEILRLQIELLNMRYDKSVRLNKKVIKTKDSTHSVQLGNQATRIVEVQNKIKKIYDSIQKTNIKFIYDEEGVQIYAEGQILKLLKEPYSSLMRKGRPWDDSFISNDTDLVSLEIQEDGGGGNNPVAAIDNEGQTYSYGFDGGGSGLDIMRRENRVFVVDQANVPPFLAYSVIWQIILNEQGQYQSIPYNGEWKEYHYNGIGKVLAWKGFYINGTAHGDFLFEEGVDGFKGLIKVVNGNPEF
ncbi:hypothetical protein N9O13_01180 [Crocinitomicaceae bacterium]|nr:hypothetical protein [Crocinitomicaceae bacterium]